MTSGLVLTYATVRELDLRWFGVHYAEIVYRVENDKLVEERRERIDPRHIGVDNGRTFLRMGNGDRVYFDSMPGKFAEDKS